MSRPTVALVFSLGVLLFTPGLAGAVPVTFKVRVPVCTPHGATINLRSNRMDANTYVHDPLTAVDPTHYQGTVDVATDPSLFRYKYSVGTCDATRCTGIEKDITFDGHGADIADRQIMAGTTMTDDLVYIWRDAVETFDATGASTGVRTPDQRVAFCAPYLSMSSEQGAVSISYDSYYGQNVTLDYGPTQSYGTSVAHTSQYRNHFQLTNLVPGQTYHYRITENGVAGIDRSFVAPTAPTGSFRFAFVGDTQYYGPSEYMTTEEVAGLVSAFRPDLILSPGDMVASLLDSTTNTWIKPEMARWNVFFFLMHDLIAGAPFNVSMGNHEEDADYFWSVFDFPKPAAPALDHYDYRYGNTLFIHLYTGVTAGYDVNGILDSQTQWLHDTLLAASQDPSVRWKIVTMHRAPFSQGSYHPTDGDQFYNGGTATRPSWGSLWEMFGVDLVLGGHNHNFTIAQNNGVHYVISCGGAPVQNISNMPWNSTTIYAEQTCSADFFAVTPKTISFSAKHPDGTPIDQGAFALCRMDADCAELANPCPQDVQWSCASKQCMHTCVTGRDHVVVQPIALSFSAVEGGANPAAQNLMISSSGTSVLSFAVTCAPPWLSCAPSSGRTPGTVAVAPDISMLHAGTYTGTVSVRDTESATAAVRTARVDLTVMHMNPMNYPPTAPTPLSPADGAMLDSPTVELVVTNATDPDHDALTYEFQLFRGQDTTPTWTKAQVAEGSGTTRVQVDRPLDRAVTYSWRARATDAGGLAGPWSVTFSFLVKAAASGDAGPIMSADGSVMSTDGGGMKPPKVNQYGCACRTEAANPPDLALGIGALVLLGFIRRRRRR